MKPPLSTSSRKKTKRTKIPISLELWNVLSNHASELSAKIGRKVSVDEFAECALECGLNDETILKRAIKEAKGMRKNEKGKDRAHIE